MLLKNSLVEPVGLQAIILLLLRISLLVEVYMICNL